MAEVTKSNEIIKQVQIGTSLHDIGGSIYNLDEVDTAITNGEEVPCLILYCGTSTELV